MVVKMIVNDPSLPDIACSLAFCYQHYLAMTGGTLATPFILSIPMCFSNNTLVISEVMSTTFFACGIVTLLQSTFGVR